MDTNNNEKQLSMAERRKNGLLGVYTGENMNQQVFTRGLCQDFNQTRPTETEKKNGNMEAAFCFLRRKYLDRTASYPCDG